VLQTALPTSMDRFGVALASSATAAAYLLGVSWAMGGSGPLLSTLVAVDVELDERSSASSSAEMFPFWRLRMLAMGGKDWSEVGGAVTSSVPVRFGVTRRCGLGGAVPRSQFDRCGHFGCH
jgi:hypothetical protein